MCFLFLILNQIERELKMSLEKLNGLTNDEYRRCKASWQELAAQIDADIKSDKSIAYDKYKLCFDKPYINEFDTVYGYVTVVDSDIAHYQMTLMDWSNHNIAQIQMIDPDLPVECHDDAPDELSFGLQIPAIRFWGNSQVTYPTSKNTLRLYQLLTNSVIKINDKRAGD